MAAFQRHFLVYFILGMPPEISVHSESEVKSWGVGGLLVWLSCRGKLPDSVRTSHRELWSTNDKKHK